MLIAIGDLHGHVRALDRIIAALDARYGILAPDGVLRSGVTLVTTGDYIDRGSQGLEVIARLRRLSRGPGRLVALLGNHELLALEALDVAAELADASTAADPIAEYERRTVHGANGGGAFLREFGPQPRPALRAYVARMARSGDVGRWIRALAPFHFARFAGKRVLFAHGDVSTALRDEARLHEYLGRVRRRVRAPTPEGMGARERWRHEDLVGAQSIFWDRSFLRLAAGADHAAQVCAAIGVDYIVSGHTPHRGITAYGERIFRVDAGMTPAFGGNEPQALVFTPAGARVVRADAGDTALVSFGDALSSAA